MFTRSLFLRLAVIPAIAILLFIPSLRLFGQGPPAHDQNDIKIGVNEVAVDVIAVDKKGKQIKDLTASDFMLSEDGVPQTIKSFKLITREGASQTTSPRGKTKSGETSVSEAADAATTKYITLVFDTRIVSQDLMGSLASARTAATHYVDDGLGENDRVSVFALGNGLQLAQTFTSDKQLLKNAIAKIGSKDGTFSSIENDITKMLNAPDVAPQSNLRDNPVPGAGGVGAGKIAYDPSVAPVYKTLAAILGTFQTEKDAEMSVRSLRALIAAHRVLPGRKAVIFFSEGFKPGSTEEANLKNVQSDANQANVSIYTIDSAGLRTESRLQQRSDELSDIGSSTRSGDTITPRGGQSRLGRAEEFGLGDAESVLDQLAEGTGGISIKNTNDLSRGIKTIDDDLRSYYLLTYEPTKQTYDGSYRRIEVKTNKPDIKLRSRDGYYAIRGLTGASFRSSELPLIGRLYENPLPSAIAVNSAAVQFVRSGTERTLTVISKVPGSSVQIKEDKSKGNSAALESLVLLMNDDNSIVAKSGQHLLFPINEKQMAQWKKTELAVRSDLVVPAGRFKLAIIVTDPAAKQCTVKITPVVIPDSDEGKLRLSSVFLVDSTSAAASNTTIPMLKTNVMPSVNGQVKPSTDQKFSLAFIVYPPKGQPAVVTVKLEFFKGSEKLAEIPPSPLPPVNADGTIPYIAALPVSAFPKGDYITRITVASGNQTATEEVSFSVLQ